MDISYREKWFCYCRSISRTGKLFCYSSVAVHIQNSSVCLFICSSNQLLSVQNALIKVSSLILSLFYLYLFQWRRMLFWKWLVCITLVCIYVYTTLLLPSSLPLFFCPFISSPLSLYLLFLISSFPSFLTFSPCPLSFVHSFISSSLSLILLFLIPSSLSHPSLSLLVFLLHPFISSHLSH